MQLYRCKQVMNVTVFSLGGSIIVPDQIDEEYLLKFVEFVKEFVKNNNKAVFICGGGKTVRRYNESFKKIHNELTNSDPHHSHTDWVGIYQTKVHAMFLQQLFHSATDLRIYPELIDDPEEFHDLGDYDIAFCSGHMPGNSTDYIAARLATTLKAQTVIVLSNIEQVYDSDPKHNKDAKALEKMSWDDYLDMIEGVEWESGMNLPLDPKAASHGAEAKQRVVFCRGTDLHNLKKYLDGEKFIGTVIHAEDIVSDIEVDSDAS